ncbi:type II toxin-antitoxin system RelE/ParE family toxin [Rodentibacter haemolyticus]|uniref:Type II toxin-antitoxin system RelE/ParE family toxin n=1 Tax=Rodentibacter haemolyticus TaxID=2778911 RepID=A0ABX6UWL4_9PAST|nr:type II toxin-antitoxin system RelE/ParE family toxin [Rodentibacter haemolyticus]QPB42232.1 type II toxin-antitoxin system RelE/ParE family toxin [Rodentibacter haemolyticus]
MTIEKEWVVIATDRFIAWVNEQDESTRESVLSTLNMLRLYGHHLSRPYADTIKGSKYSNMKELRIQHKGKPLRAFFAFDPLRQAIVLCAGDKSNDKKFYERMLRIADDEFSAYLQELEK